MQLERGKGWEQAGQAQERTGLPSPAILRGFHLGVGKSPGSKWLGWREWGAMRTSVSMLWQQSHGGGG